MRGHSDPRGRDGGERHHVAADHCAWLTLPTIQDEFSATLSELQWTLTVYSLTYASLLIVGGKLGDIFGHRRLFLTGLTVLGSAPSRGVRNLSTLAHLQPRGDRCRRRNDPPCVALDPDARVRGTQPCPRDREWGGASGLVSGLGPPSAEFSPAGRMARHLLADCRHRGVHPRGRLPRRGRVAGPDASRRIDYTGVVLSRGGDPMLSFALIQGPPNGWTSTPTLVGLGASATPVHRPLRRGAAVAQPDPRALAPAPPDSSSAGVGHEVG